MADELVSEIPRRWSLRPGLWVGSSIALFAAVALGARAVLQGYQPSQSSRKAPPQTTPLNGPLAKAVAADPLDINSRWRLCERLEAAYDENRDRTVLPDILACYTGLWSAAVGLEQLPESHPKRRWLLYLRKIAHTAGDRHLRYAEGHLERIAKAAEFLLHAVADDSYCHSADQTVALAFDTRKNVGSCARAYALLLLALRATGAAVDEAFRASQELPAAGRLSWESSGQVHLQRPGCLAKPFWDASDFPWIKKLEAETEQMRTELRALLAQRDAPLFKADKGALVELLSDDGAWTNLRLHEKGRWHDELCAVLPTICAVLGDLQELNRTNYKGYCGTESSFTTQAPHLGVNVYRLEPGKKIAPHFGTHSRLTVSLGLDVPKGAEATLTVGAAGHLWRQGEAMVFDDAFEHSVVHQGTLPRYVLGVMFLHPDAFKGP